MPNLIATPETFGISERMLVRLDSEPTHQHLPYLDLMPGSPYSTVVDVLPEAVLETNGRAAMYLVSDNPSRRLVADSDRLHRLREMLACRADARYLGVLEPGILHIYPVGLFTGRVPGAIRQLSLQGGTDLHDFLIGQLDSPTDTGRRTVKADKAWLDNYLFELLRSTARNLKMSDALTDGQVLSLVGRGLFARFIADRRIVGDADVSRISSRARTLDDLFASPAAAADTFAWLDSTFNGNLLPLLEGDIHSAEAYRAFFVDIGDTATQAICIHLGNIMQRAVDGQLPLPWQRIQFAHVPADTLSQVYEHFARYYWKEFADATSIHYTPRHIAQMLVDAAFAGLCNEEASYAKVLDPAAGAGVFLVLAFKRLVQERWQETGKRPTRRAIRDILNTQLCGLDTNVEALKFAALSLYLTALELDPSPTPLSELKFKELDKTGTLLDVSKGGQTVHDRRSGKTIELGSLSATLRQLEDRRFDIVIGNPPWTQLGQQAAQPLTRLVRNIARRQGVTEETTDRLQVDNGIPDIPFVWRALEWAKPGGMIAYALHAQHLLFQQGSGAAMRRALLGCLDITGILNGSALRNTPVWPTVTAPFCFLLARNRKPRGDSSFYYLNPARERAMNREGRFRLDPHTAIPVVQNLVKTSPHLFKTLYRGTSLDHGIVARIAAHPTALPIANYWKSLGLKNGKGFQVASKKKPASHLWGKKMLEVEDEVGYQIDIDRLRDFNYPGLHSDRDPDIYLGPLALLRESPKFDRKQRGGLLACGEVVYSESFVGYSTANYVRGGALARYLQLLSYSDVFLYCLLMTSSKFGVERDSILKEDIDLFPIVPFETLSQKQCEQLSALSASLIAGESPWDDIDTFVASLYGLNATDGQVIHDTLATALPFSETEKFAGQAPSTDILQTFATEIQRIVLPFAQQLGLSFWARVETAYGDGCWRFVRIGFFAPGRRDTYAIPPDILAHGLADQFWASQIRVYIDHAGSEIVIGQLAHNRYWTKTRARLLALDLLNTELEKHAGQTRDGSQH